MLSLSKVAGFTIGLALITQTITPSWADSTTLHGSASKTHLKSSTYFSQHPKVKAATIGAGVGAGAGALTGLITHKGVMRGAAIGAGTGAGVGLVQSSRTMKRHPIIKDVAEGTLVGGGLGLAGSRQGRTAVKTAGVGAAVGLGAGLLKNLR
jgi:hypothetical protein